MKALRTGGTPDSPHVLLDFYSGDSAAGLFAARFVSHAALAELLEAIDKLLTQRQQLPLKIPMATAHSHHRACEGALRSMPHGKAPGLDSSAYEFYQRFWPIVGDELTAVLQDALSAQHCLHR